MLSEPTVERVALSNLAYRITQWREGKGFYTPSSISVHQGAKPLSHADAMLGKLALVHSELDEAYQAYCQHDLDGPDGVVKELADTAIRVLDIAGACSLDLEEWLMKLGEVEDPGVPPGARLPEFLLYLHGLVTECAEATRRENVEYFALGLARLYGGLMEATDLFGRGLQAEIDKKMAVNEQRPVRHGKKTLL